jgi:hypothetical protein
MPALSACLASSKPPQRPAPILIELPSAAHPDRPSFPGIGRCPPVKVLVGPQEVVPGPEAGHLDSGIPERVTARSAAVRRLRFSVPKKRSMRPFSQGEKGLVRWARMPIRANKTRQSQERNGGSLSVRRINPRLSALRSSPRPRAVRLPALSRGRMSAQYGKTPSGSAG